MTTATRSATTTINQVLRDLGLRRGHDYVIRGYYGRVDGYRTRIGTRINPLTDYAERVIADSVDAIQDRTPFMVTVHRTRSGMPITYVYGPA